jgi:hypothetical protein
MERLVRCIRYCYTRNWRNNGLVVVHGHNIEREQWHLVVENELTGEVSYCRPQYVVCCPHVRQRTFTFVETKEHTTISCFLPADVKRLNREQPSQVHIHQTYTYKSSVEICSRWISSTARNIPHLTKLYIDLILLTYCCFRQGTSNNWYN